MTEAGTAIRSSFPLGNAFVLRCLQVAVPLFALLALPPSTKAQKIIGSNTTPHQFSAEMRWRRAPNPELAAKCELFLHNNTKTPIRLSAEEIRFDNETPQTLLAHGDWAWHDTPASWLSGEEQLLPGCLTVFTINGQSSQWGVETKHKLRLSSRAELPLEFTQPEAWLSSVTFLAMDDQKRMTDAVRPNRIVVHVENSGNPFELDELCIWLPPDDQSHHIFQLAHRYSNLAKFPANGMITSNAKGGFTVDCEPLPLTYCVLELRVRDANSSAIRSLWSHLRIKREAFDISGGWVASDVNGRNSLTIDDYVRTLKRMHINTGQIQEVGGFTDNAEAYARLPLKRFNRLWPLERYDRDAMLSQIHAVEFLGEPQYGGGRPVPPQEVWEKLAPYQPSRLATSLTLSEERTWRYYAGLSDYPHYDAYRVIAPAADSWREYDRWQGERIRWGAPLETIGVMTRSLRELSRPRPIAYWSQGAHHGWGGRWSPRRGSPNPAELRSQAWQGLSNRVTSLYWFNLSLKSLTKYPDLIEPITRVNREMRMLEEVFLHGDAYEYRRITSNDRPDWDLNSIASADTAMLVALDLNYGIDPEAREFTFETRSGEFTFKKPPWLSGDLQVFRVDSNGTHDIEHTVTNDTIEIREPIHVVGIFVATLDPSLRARLNTVNSNLRKLEDDTRFDPGSNVADLQKLKSYLSE